MAKIKILPADTWFSKCVRHSKNWTCELCGSFYPKGLTTGKAQGLDCSHIFGRRHRSVRWYSGNAQALCMSCHNWYHEEPTESGIWIVETLGKKNYEKLVEKKNTIIKISKKDEKEISKHYIQEYRRMVKDGSFVFKNWEGI